MSNAIKSIRRFFAPTPIEPVSPGMYHYISPQNDPRNYRLHLRIEVDGGGILIVNASTVLHLNQTAAEYAYYFVQNRTADEVTQTMNRRYNVDPEQARSDYHHLTERILTLIEIPDLDPVTFLDFERQDPYSGEISAPYRMDCALTYQLPETAPPDAAPTKRVTRELDTQEWQRILDKAWEVGIPHVIFTGGEPTLRSDLVQLIAHAEKNGQVSGLLTDGNLLSDQEYFQELLQTGLDHLLIRLNPDYEQIWSIIENVLAEDIFLAVHITITPKNKSNIADTLLKLSELGVYAISLSAASDELDDDLEAARELVAEKDISLVWDLPVPYSTHNPIALEVVDEHPPAAAGRAWLYIEPDGDVLPAQGYNFVLGNVLENSWEQIWQSSRAIQKEPSKQ